MTINVNMSPRDGYIFREADGTLLTAASWKGLSKRVMIYRVNAGKPPGNPMAEVLTQACQRNPDLCVSENTQPYPPQNKDPRSRIKIRLLQWLARWLKQKKSPEGINFVGEAESIVRSAVCAACPKNLNLPEGCASCRTALASMRKEILGGARVLDKRLNGCDVLGADLQTAVHLDEIRVNDAGLPAGCWRKIEV